MDNFSNLKTKLLAENDDYFNNIFKKTENIVKAVSYILVNVKETEKTKYYTNRLRDKIFKIHDFILFTLQLQEHEQVNRLKELRQELVELMSYIGLAQTVHIVSRSITELLLEQIDRVIRYLNNHWLLNVDSHDVQMSVISNDNIFNHFSDNNQTQLEKDSVTKNIKKPKATRIKIPEGDISSDAYLVYSQLSNRGERIKTILAAKPEATIKDIAEVITDVSEKTIQRELNNLIKKGQVIREGERRWSKYSLR